ncbi:hypothetical protein [Natronorarus salvus]|uniref:hypothetical protein n=1 Tax=Natronorarus salvus TaxID=3117733 RepID=UPI002F26D514
MFGESNGVSRRRFVRGTVAAGIGVVAITGATPAAAEESNSVDLYANEDELVGSITLSGGEEGLEVTYDLDEDSEWSIVETHLHVGDIDDVTNPGGNPRPGHFEYSSEHELEDETASVTHLVETDEEGEVDVAAHAELAMVVEEDDEEEDEENGDEGEEEGDEEDAEIAQENGDDNGDDEEETGDGEEGEDEEEDGDDEEEEGDDEEEDEEEVVTVSAWADGDRISDGRGRGNGRGSWATYFTYDLDAE